MRPASDTPDVGGDTTKADVGSEAGETRRPTDEKVETVYRDETGEGRRSP